MATQAIGNAPSGRFIKTYLLIWGFLAAGALTYLATLAWQPGPMAPAPRQPQTSEPDPGLRAMSRALAEVRTIGQTVTELQKDVSHLKGAAEQRDAQEKEVRSRLSALEERVTTMPVTVATPAPPPTAKQKAAEKAAQIKAAAAQQKAAQAKAAAPRIISVAEPPASAPAPAVKANAAPAPLVTGSIAQPQATIVFGEPVVTKARESVFGVQLAAAPSIDALRLSWSLLLERHGAALATLQPRVVRPRTEGAPYRLVAGPLPSMAEANQICGELRAQQASCASTDFVGEPL
ncbi:MAG: SPOR domain-containing protein [Hyphomicrobiaceae bacterium]|nr:MAG: SPOR domain-containing protein [Hyphomicrobiaceae bacterium]